MLSNLQASSTLFWPVRGSERALSRAEVANPEVGKEDAFIHFSGGTCYLLHITTGTGLGFDLGVDASGPGDKDDPRNS